MQKVSMMGAASAMGGGFHLFPVQVGPCTQYARDKQQIFLAVTIYQFLMAVMALVEFWNFLSAIVMTIGCLVAWWAHKEDMNITYICWWGVLSALGFIAGMVAALIGFAIKISTIIIKFNIPLSCFFGMVLAWRLYTNYEEEQPDSHDMLGCWLRAFGLLSQPKPLKPKGNQFDPLKKGLPQFGTANLDSMKGQAGAYNTMAQGEIQKDVAWLKAQESGMASSLFGGAASAPPGPPPAQDPATGSCNLGADPFMTSRA